METVSDASSALLPPRVHLGLATIEGNVLTLIKITCEQSPALAPVAALMRS